MKFSVLFLLALVSCTGGEESKVEEFLVKNMKQSNLEVASVTLGEKVTAGDAQKQDLALMGLKDSTSYPLTVTFKVKEDCVAVAEAIPNDVLFGEKKISCRSVKAGSKPDLKYVKQYNFGAFGRKIAVYEEGKVIKAGETFSVKGEWVHLTTLKDEKKTAPLFKGLN